MLVRCSLIPPMCDWRLPGFIGACGCFDGRADIDLDRTLKGIGIMDAAPTYEALSGFARYVLRWIWTVETRWLTRVSRADLRETSVAAVTLLVAVITHMHLLKSTFILGVCWVPCSLTKFVVGSPLSTPPRVAWFRPSRLKTCSSWASPRSAPT